MDIQKKIADVIRDKKTQLPTLPVMVDNILSAARDERTSAQHLAGFIIKDQAISNKILKLANSAYYGLAREVDSISRAITVIGFNEIIGLTIGMNVVSTLSQDGAHKIFDMRDLWLHSIACATGARQLAKRLKINRAEQVFLNGLLHDTGKIIFGTYFSKEYRPVVESARGSQTALHVKEKQLLGIDHGVLSGMLMENWHFPDSLLLPCRFHHDSLACPDDYREQAMIVEFADFLCQRAQIGFSGNPAIHDPESVGQELGLTPEDIEELVQGFEEERPQIEEFLELIT
jgi:HD-like signal output (HDOD) protein